jgi:hypothetical protein
MGEIITGVNGGTFPNVAVVPLPGEVITAASIKTPVLAVLHECKHLFDIKGALAVANTWTAKQTFDIGGGGGVGIETAADTTCTFGGLVTCNGGLTVPTGQTLTVAAGGVLTCAGTLGVTGAAVFNGAVTFNDPAEATDDFEISGTAILSGLVQYSDPNRLSDADQTIDTSGGYTVVLATTAANTTRTITLKQTTAQVPLQGEQLKICGSDQMGAPANDLNYIIVREGGTEIAYLYGTQAWLEVQFDGTNWRALRSSGHHAVAGNGVFSNVVRKTGW